MIHPDKTIITTTRRWKVMFSKYDYISVNRTKGDGAAVIDGRSGHGAQQFYMEITKEDAEALIYALQSAFEIV